jgi:hypothetical protein
MTNGQSSCGYMKASSRMKSANWTMRLVAPGTDPLIVRIVELAVLAFDVDGAKVDRPIVGLRCSLSAGMRSDACRTIAGDHSRFPASTRPQRRACRLPPRPGHRRCHPSRWRSRLPRHGRSGPLIHVRRCLAIHSGTTPRNRWYAIGLRGSSPLASLARFSATLVLTSVKLTSGHESQAKPASLALKHPVQRP